MKQVIQNFKTGELKVDDVPTPILKRSGVLVQNYFSVISAGTERTTVSVGKSSLLGKAKQKPEQVKQVLETLKKDGFITTYNKVQNKLSEPKALGYSSAGRVIKVSDDIDHIKIGDFVACGGQDFASHAEVVFIPKNLVAKIPEGVQLEEAAFTTMGSIAMQGVRLCQPELGHKVAVIGMGLLGNIAVQILNASGCEVMALDVSDKAIDGIRDYGATSSANIISENIMQICSDFTNGYGFDSILITAGTSSNQPIEIAGEISRKKGRVVVTGAVRMDIPRDNYFKKEIEVVISSSYGPGRYDKNYEENGIDYPYQYVRFTENRNFQTFLSLLKLKKIKINSLISHKFSIENAEKAYDLVLGNNNEHFTSILLTYSQEQLSKKHQTIMINSNLNETGIGFIGAGSYAQSYLIPSAKESKEPLIGVCTGNGINSKSIANKFQFQFSTTSHDEIIKNNNVNTVFIATRHNNHAELTIKALENNKHVFVEKPLALNKIELDQIIEIYSNIKTKPHLMVGFNRRYSSLSIELKNSFKNSTEPIIINYRINAGFIPKDNWIQSKEEGGGRVIGEICHFVDYCKFLTDSKIITVYAKSIKSDNSVLTNEDNIIITLAFKNGSIAVITYVANGDKSVPKERIEVTGGNQYAILRDFSSIELVNNSKSKRIKKADKGQKKCVQKFIESIKTKQALIDFEDLIEVTDVTFDILKSLNDNCQIQRMD